uniref:Transcription factor Dp-1 n=1 Tax=Globodera rostochiensis TaxID=31243 RepID=A0A914HTI4_GLORO
MMSYDKSDVIFVISDLDNPRITGQSQQLQRPRFDQTSPSSAQPMRAFQIRHRSTDKTRGLRHFAHKVCEKVKQKVQTNYNEVAEELVTEYFDHLSEVPTDPEKLQYDTRNIRRRVYDALNVLMAMNIIEKEKKEIRWVGLPTSSLAECRRLEEEKAQRQERIRQKTEQLQELIVQLVSYKSLVQRNRERERLHGRPLDSSILYLPYIIVSTNKKTVVECAIAPDKSEYWFNFDSPFEIHDDIEVLKRLGLAYGIDRGEADPAYVPHIKACLPPALRDYVDQILEGALNLQPIEKQRETLPSSRELEQFDKRSAVKLDPNTGAVSRKTPNESIVVRATRANLSGIAPSEDGGPMGSFLGPVTLTAATKSSLHQQNVIETARPVARYAVIPRPISARYTSFNDGVDHYQQMPNQHQIYRGETGPHLGGILHDHFDYQPHRQHFQHNQGQGMPYGAEGMVEYPLERYGEMEEHLMGAPPGDQKIVVNVEEEVIVEEEEDLH